MQEITGNVCVETAYQGANVGFVTTSEGIVMIDTPQRPSDALRWRGEVTKRGEVRYIINTEHHGDHITGNYFFSGTVVAHRGTKDAFPTVLGSLAQLRERVKMMDPDGLRLIEGYRPKAPTITYTDKMALYVGSHTFHLIHLPGHTVYETVVYVPEERVVFSGDNVTYKTGAFLHDADAFGWLKSLEWLAALDVDFIVPGHGEVCDKSYLPEYNQLISGWIDATREAMAKGLGRDEAAEQVAQALRYPNRTEAFVMDYLRQGVRRIYDAVQAGA